MNQWSRREIESVRAGGTIRMMLYKMASKPNPISLKMLNLFSFASIIVILDPQLQVSQVMLTLVSRAFQVDHTFQESRAFLKNPAFQEKCAFQESPTWHRRTPEATNRCGSHSQQTGFSAKRQIQTICCECDHSRRFARSTTHDRVICGGLPYIRAQIRKN